MLIRIIRALRKHGFMVLVKYGFSLVRSLLFRKYYQTVVRLKVVVGRTTLFHWGINRSRSGGEGIYRAVALGDVGYAIRCLSFVSDSPGSRNGYLLTADVGDDVVSIVPFNGDRFGHRRKICFPQKSAPIFVTTFNTGAAEETLNILIGTFNFDENDQEVKNSCIYELRSANALLTGNDKQLQSRQVLKTLLCREGHYGFRAADSYRHQSGAIYLAISDRNQDMVLIGVIQGADAGTDDLEFQHVRLSDSKTPVLEPVGVSLLPSSDGDAPPRVAVGQRKSEAISILSQDE